MAINTNVWGVENSWINYNPVDVNLNYIKIPQFTDLTNGIQNGNIAPNEQLDMSITTVQADSGFSGGIVNFARGDGRNNFDEKYINKDIYSEFEIKNIGLFSTSTNRTAREDLYIDNFNEYTLAPNYDSNNNLNTVKPVLTFGKNSNIKLLVGVLYNNDYNSKTYTFKALDAFASSGGKYVYGVYAIPMYKQSDGTYNISDYNDFSLTHQILNYSQKSFDWYTGNNLALNSKIYSMVEKTELALAFDWGGFSIQTSQLFPIFSQSSDYNNDVRALWGVYDNYYYSSIGFIPNFTNSELELNGKITENGVTIRKGYIDNVNDVQWQTLYRYIDLTDTDYWGNDYEKFKEWCRTQTAYFGMFFCTYWGARNKSLNDADTYLGIIDETGTTHGIYTRGTENEEQQNFDNDIISDIEKIPPKEVQKDKGDLTSNINPFLYNSPNQLFLLNTTDLNNLFTFINIGYRPTEENFILDFKGKNPIDYIVSVNVFPFDIPAFSPAEVDLTIGGIPVKKSPFLENSETVKVKTLGLGSQFIQPIFDFGTIAINPYFNDFRDYEPFTRCEVQLPYCGSYTVDLKKFMNKNLSVKYVLDYNTGACTALIFLNDLLIDTVDGQIGFSIPLSGISQGEYQNTIQRNSYNAKMAGYDIVKSGINQIGNILTGNLKATANSTVNSLSAIETGLQANYELTHTAPQPTILSTADALNSFCQDNRARVIFYRCEIPNYNEEVFKKTVGYACIKSGKVSDFSGLMICSNVKLDNINCTDTEKNMLKNLLTSGIYN